MNKRVEIMGIKPHLQLLTLLEPDFTVERSSSDLAARNGLFYAASSKYKVFSFLHVK